MEVLFIGLCSVLCGGQNCQDMEDFGKSREAWLRKYLKLKHGVPSYDTFRRERYRNSSISST